MPNPTPDQLASIRRLLPPKTKNAQSLTEDYIPLLTYLEGELELSISAKNDQSVYTAGWSILWSARNRLINEVESAYENAVTLRLSGEGGGHAMLMHTLELLGYNTTSSNEAERIASRVIEGKL